MILLKLELNFTKLILMVSQVKLLQLLQSLKKKKSRKKRHLNPLQLLKLQKLLLLSQSKLNPPLSLHKKLQLLPHQPISRLLLKRLQLKSLAQELR